MAIEIFSKQNLKTVLSVRVRGGFWGTFQNHEKEVTWGNFEKNVFFKMKKKRHPRLRLVKVEKKFFLSQITYGKS